MTQVVRRLDRSLSDVPLGSHIETRAPLAFWGIEVDIGASGEVLHGLWGYGDGLDKIDQDWTVVDAGDLHAVSYVVFNTKRFGYFGVDGVETIPVVDLLADQKTSDYAVLGVTDKLREGQRPEVLLNRDVTTIGEFKAALIDPFLCSAFDPAIPAHLLDTMAFHSLFSSG